MLQHDQKAQQLKEIQERMSPSGKMVYAAIHAEALEELDRPTLSLLWSGLAAGLSMGFSALGVAMLQTYLPHAEWQVLVSRLGYSLGFLIVILGRQQLFTENTLTPILPLMQNRNLETLLNVMRLWAAVLIANLIGTLIIGFVFAHAGALQDEVHKTLIQVAKTATGGSFGSLVLRGVFAGWLIAMIVWLLPFSESAKIWVIVIITYVVALGHFPHVVAGAVEAFELAWLGEVSWAHAVFGFLLPTLIGNIIGGVTMVAALNHAQVVSGRGTQKEAEAVADREP